MVVVWVKLPKLVALTKRVCFPFLNVSKEALVA